MKSFKEFVAEMNDNQSKEDVVRAKRDTIKRLAQAKTEDEKKFYKAKLEALKEANFPKQKWTRDDSFYRAKLPLGAMALGVAGAALGGPHVAAATMATTTLARVIRHELKKRKQMNETFDDVVQAAKYGLSNKAALAMIAAPIPLSMPAGLTLATVKAVQDYRRRQKLRKKLK